MLQPIEDLEEWQKKDDPWGYEDNPEDTKRRDILLSEIPDKIYKNVLDIGSGQGFITKHLPGERIIGVDISHEAIKKAKVFESDRIKFIQCSLFELNKIFDEKFDLMIIAGVLYPQYIGNSLNLIYLIVNKLLQESGILMSVHINSWYKGRFPYLLLKEYFYDYREYLHRLEVYIK
jgi:predicted TPR repeat methyltransferase